jgi:hypothetical protein
MVMVVRLRCPECGTGGSLVLSYGPDASAEDADVVRTLQRTPSGDGSARNGTPR